MKALLWVVGFGGGQLVGVDTILDSLLLMVHAMIEAMYRVKMINISCVVKLGKKIT